MSSRSIAVRRPLERGVEDVWPVVDGAGRFVLEPDEVVRWEGRADVSGLRYNGSAFEAEWNIADFAHVMLTDRRLMYRGLRLKDGPSPHILPADRLAPGFGTSYVVGQVRHDWVSNVMLEVQRGARVLRLGQFELSYIDRDGPLRVTVLLTPTLRPGSSGRRAQELAEIAVRDIAARRLGASLPPDEMAALKEQASRPTAVTTRPNRRRWDLPGPRWRGRPVAVLVPGGSDPDSKISELRTAAMDLSVPAIHRSGALARLGSELHDRYHRDRRVPELVEAIQAYRAALDLTDPDSPQYPKRTADLALLLIHEFEHGRNFVSLDEAVAIQRNLWARNLPDTPQYRHMLRTLGRALRIRFENGGPDTFLEEAITINRTLLPLTTNDDPESRRLSSELARCLIVRLRRVGRVEDAAEAITLLSAPTMGTTDEKADLSNKSNLGVAYFYRYERLSAADDLREAIRLWRHTVRSTNADDPDLASRLSNLGNGLQRRFSDLGTLDDLEEAIALYERSAVIYQAASDPHDRSILLGNLSTALIHSYHRSHDDRTWQRAVDVAREAIRIAAPVGLLHAEAEDALSRAFRARARHRGSIEDMNRAVAHARAAVRLVAADHGQWSLYQNALAGHLQARFEMTGAAADLDEAIMVSRSVIGAARAGHPLSAEYQTRLANLLNARPQSRPEKAGLDEALALWLAAGENRSATTWARFDASRLRGAALAAAGRWAEAADAYEGAVLLLPELAGSGLNWGSRERLLSEGAPRLALDAAAACLHIDDPVRAIGLLELGRAVIWNVVLDARTDVSRLHAAAPELAEVLTAAQRQLNESAQVGADVRLEAVRVRDATLKAIRALPAFERFMLPPSADELKAASCGDPVVVINVSSWRCDAVVISAGGMQVIPLPGLAHEAVTRRTVDYVNALAQATSGKSSPRKRQAAERVIGETLGWLWETTVHPILDALGATDRTGGWPAIWWSPTGLMTLLPLHAAGTCLDTVISSYTPTLRLLVESRRRPRAGVPSALVVALSQSPGEQDLPGVKNEVGTLRRLVGQTVILQDEQATKATVLRSLDHCSAVHFSCHATQRLDAPSNGGLVLHDGILSVAEIAAAHQTEGELAFLSACQTAMGGSRLFDQALSITDALRHCGWRHVIGTQWKVFDTTAARVTEQVYSAISDAGVLRPEQVAEALHHAIRHERSLKPDKPSTWVPFIHSGP